MLYLQLNIRNGTSYRVYVYENNSDIISQSKMFMKSRNLQGSLLLLEKKCTYIVII